MTVQTPMIVLKRVYLPPLAEDGFRVLVERLWPRGVSTEKAAIHQWLKELAPSPGLRVWFDHNLAKWDGFQQRYREELATHEHLLNGLRQRAESETVTLVYAASDERHNSALVLKAVLDAL